MGIGNGANLGTTLGNNLSSEENIDKKLGPDLHNGLGIIFDVAFDFDVY